VSRHSTQDEVPAVTPYDRKKICTLCNVEVRAAALCIRLSGFNTLYLKRVARNSYRN